MNLIELHNVSEKYRIKFVRNTTVSWEEIWALSGIDLEIEAGEVLGIIGHNGSGKTTLLKLIAGMLIPDKGSINVSGRVSALMELGAGFNPEFTGRENIMLNAAIYGLAEKDAAEKTNEIIEFADLGKFIDALTKYYSQGMYMRLAFALAIFAAPDILLIDDILAVGDEEAQQKCIKKVFDLKKDKKTILLVSHDMYMVKKLCDKVILLEKGSIKEQGAPQKVITSYLETVGNKRGISVLEEDRWRIVFNNGRVSITYKGIALTKGMGGYLAFYDDAMNWCLSYNLSWQTMDCAPGIIITEGATREGTFRQVWTLMFKNGEIIWGIKPEGEFLKRAHLDLIITPDYDRWIMLDKDGFFPAFINKSNWQDLGLEKCPEGITCLASTRGDLPAFIINKTEANPIRLFNTGYEDDSRVIQYEMNGYDPISIKLVENRHEFEDYIKRARERFLSKGQKERIKIVHE